MSVMTLGEFNERCKKSRNEGIPLRPGIRSQLNVYQVLELVTSHLIRDSIDSQFVLNEPIPPALFSREQVAASLATVISGAFFPIEPASRWQRFPRQPRMATYDCSEAERYFARLAKNLVAKRQPACQIFTHQNQPMFLRKTKYGDDGGYGATSALSLMDGITAGGVPVPQFSLVRLDRAQDCVIIPHLEATEIHDVQGITNITFLRLSPFGLNDRDAKTYLPEHKKAAGGTSGADILRAVQTALQDLR